MLMTAHVRSSYRSVTEDKYFVSVKIHTDSIGVVGNDEFETIQGHLEVDITKNSVLFQSMSVQLFGHFSYGDLDQDVFYDMSKVNIQFLPAPKKRNEPKFPSSGKVLESKYIPQDSLQSPYAFHVIKCSLEKSERTLAKGTHILPFVLRLNSTPFPATLEESFGKIVYKIVASFKILMDESIEDEEIVQLRGHLNLPKNPSALFSGCTVKGKIVDESASTLGKLFGLSNSKRNHKGANLILFLPQVDFVGGENVDFRLTLQNPACDAVENVTISLVQKFMICKWQGVKTESKTLVSKNMSECPYFTTDVGDFVWENRFEIPNGLTPTYTIRDNGLQKRVLFGIKYFVQFVGKFEGSEIMMRGEQEIKIGTTRSGQNLSNSDLLSPGDLDLSRRRSSWSMTSTSTSPEPPSYSNLSSRRPSLETLPPAYDEARWCGKI